MRSGTSCFNGTLYRKTWQRFWPLWGLYGAVWALILPIRFLAAAMDKSSGYYYAMGHAEYLQDLAKDAPDELGLGLLLAMAAGLACAMAVFGYLYQSRSACMMHALPMRRETLFCTQYLAGLLFLLLPHLAVFGLMAAAEASFQCLALKELTVWLLAQSGMCLFFYSFGVFCAMFTGNLVALPVFYGILNGLVYIIASLLESVCQQFLFGFSRFPDPVWDAVDWLTPYVRLINAAGAAEDNLSCFAVYAAAGAVLAGLALLVYRTRHIESAGDVVSVRLVRPVFKYGVALCAALTGGMITASILNDSSGLTLGVCMLIWGLAGYFAAEMLLRKSFRVFRAWKGAAVLAGVIVLLCLSVGMDWYGFEDKVPDANQVESVELYSLNSAPYDSALWGTLTLTDPEQIALVTGLHQSIVDQKETLQSDAYLYDDTGEETEATAYINPDIWYTMKDGSVMKRSYSILLRESDLQTEGTAAWYTNAIVTNRDNAAQMYNLAQLEQPEFRLTGAYVYNVWNTETEQYEDLYADGSVQKIWDAVKQDFADGTIGVRYLFDDSQERMDNTCVADLEFEFDYEVKPEGDAPEDSAEVYTWTITLTPNAKNTLAALRDAGVLDDTHIALTQTQENQFNSVEASDTTEEFGPFNADGTPITQAEDELSVSEALG